MSRILLILYLLLAAIPANAKESSTPDTFKARGMIVAVHQPIIASEIAARITRIPLQEGAYFKKGALLVGFDDTLLRAQKNKTRVELEAARLKLENSEQLEALESIGALEVSLAKVEVKRREAEMAITDISLRRSNIRAPFNGRIDTLYVDEHESVGPQEKLMKIISTDQLEVEAMVPSKWLGWIHKKMRCIIHLDALDKKCGASIKSIGATVDPVSKMVKLRARLLTYPKNLLPGMTGTVIFEHP